VRSRSGCGPSASSAGSNGDCAELNWMISVKESLSTSQPTANELTTGHTSYDVHTKMLSFLGAEVVSRPTFWLRPWSQNHGLGLKHLASAGPRRIVLTPENLSCTVSFIVTFYSSTFDLSLGFGTEQKLSLATISAF